MSDDGEDIEGDYDEPILFEDEDENEESDNEEKSSSEDEDENEEEIDIDDDEITIPVVEEIKKFKDTKKIKINAVLQKSNTPRTILIVDENKKITDNRLQKTELAHIIAMRSTQIAKYGTHFAVNFTNKDPTEIAFKELYTRKCPIILKRKIGEGNNGESIVEYWDVNTMILPVTA